jgi:futalosine hydrolase
MGRETMARTNQQNTHGEESSPAVLVAAATETELRPLRDLLPAFRAEWIGGRRAFAGALDGTPLRLLITGPGAVNAAQAVTALLEKEHPPLLVGMGCAGVFRPSRLCLGDVAVAAAEIDVQAGIEHEDPTGPVTEYPFPLVEKGGHSYTQRFPCAPQLLAPAREIIGEALAPENVGVGLGPFVSVSTITSTQRRADMLWTAYKPVMETMEGAALAQVTLHYGIPFLEIRAGSNWVGPRDRRSWQVELASRRAAQAVAAVIRRLAGQPDWPGSTAGADTALP